MVSPSEKKVLMRQEAESKLLAQANARDPEVRLVKIRSGKGKVYICEFLKTPKNIFGPKNDLMSIMFDNSGSVLTYFKTKMLN